MFHIIAINFQGVFSEMLGLIMSDFDGVLHKLPPLFCLQTMKNVVFCMGVKALNKSKCLNIFCETDKKI